MGSNVKSLSVQKVNNFRKTFQEDNKNSKLLRLNLVPTTANKIMTLHFIGEYSRLGLFLAFPTLFTIQITRAERMLCYYAVYVWSLDSAYLH